MPEVIHEPHYRLRSVLVDTEHLVAKIYGEMQRQSLSASELALRAGMKPSTLTRIFDGTTKQPHPRTIRRLDSALGNRVLDVSHDSVPRDAVRAVDVGMLGDALRKAELDRFLSSGVVPASFARPGFVGLPKAAPERLRQLDASRPLDLQSLAGLASAIGVREKLPSLRRAAPSQVLGWLDDFGKALDQSCVRGPGHVDQKVVSAANRHVEYLSGPALDRGSETDVVIALAGRTQVRERAETAASLAAANHNCHLLVIGAPAVEGDSLLSEADAAAAIVRDLPHVQLTNSEITIDGRSRSFRDSAVLAIGHLTSNVFRDKYPLRLALVAGPLSGRRAWMLFEEALSVHVSLVQSIAVAPTTTDEFRRLPARGTEAAQLRFAGALRTQTESLLFTRFVGFA